MGAGASNISKSKLDVYQTAVTQIGQNLRSKAKNNAQQTSDINQTINLKIGVTDLCEQVFINKRICDNDCQFNNRTPTYQCQFRTDQGTISNETNTFNCDAAFNTTLEQAKFNDGICDGSKDMNEEEREQICLNRALRLTCPVNQQRIFGSDNQGQIIDSGIYGYTTNTCDNSCANTIYIKKGKNGTNNTYDYELANGLPYYQDPGGDTIKIDTGNFFVCRLSDQGGSNYLNNIPLSQCLDQCSENNNCSTLKEQTVLGVIDCGGQACISNTATSSLQSDQLAESNIKSEMTAEIMNDFTSEVLKTISQVNEGLNFGQFNMSDEMTEITQTIRNKIINNITNSTENELTQGDQINQNITIEVFGKLYGSNSCPTTKLDFSECDKITDDTLKKECQNKIAENWSNSEISEQTCVPPDGSGVCGCKIDNNAVSDLQNKQEAKSVIDSIFNSKVINDLTSKYTLEVSQLNKGLSFNFIWIIVALILGGAYIIGKSISSVGNILKQITNPKVLFGLFIIIGGIVLIVLIATGVIGSDDETEQKCKRPDNGCEIGGGISSLSCNRWSGCNYNEKTNICETLPDSNCKSTTIEIESSKEVNTNVNAPICVSNPPACNLEKEII